MATTITSKGQVTVPKKFRDYLGLRPGSKVNFMLDDRGKVIVLPNPAAPQRKHTQRFTKMRGTLVTGKSTDELMQLLRGYDTDAKDPGFSQ